VTEIPSIVVTRTKNGMEFWCPHCKCKHFHGLGGPGHYVAHCWWAKSPYKTTGYNLVFAEVPA
jgi:hypothetical protein